MKDAVLAKTRQFEGCAAGWIAAWNSHSIDAIMSHYAEDVTVKSPFTSQLRPYLLGEDGKAKRVLRHYAVV